MPTPPLAELVAQLGQVEEDIKVSEERRRFLEMSVKQLQQASAASTTTSREPAASSSQSRVRNERLVELLRNLEASVASASSSREGVSVDARYLECLQMYLASVRDCSGVLRERLGKNRDDQGSLRQESAEYRALGIEEYCKKLDGRVAELERFAIEDEHALSVVESEAGGAYRSFKAHWPQHAGSLELTELEVLASSLGLGD
jgi:hypothetical protein